MDLLEQCLTSKKLWETILTSLKQVILVSDILGNTLYASSTSEAVFGYTPEELHGKSLCVIFTSEDLSCLFPNILYLARKNQTYEGEVMLIRKDGTRFIAFMTAQPTVDPRSGENIVVLLVHDIDKQKQFERSFARAHYQDLVKIANGIAHEIRNPLVGVGGFLTRLFKSCGETPELRKYYEVATHNLKKIDNLIKKVELFAKLPKPYLQQIPLSGLIDDVVGPYFEEMRQRGVDVFLRLEEMIIFADRDLIARAVAIFLENALDALPDGGKIEIGAEVNEDRYVIRVTDTGKGIDQQDLPFIFNPFFSTKPDGVGIDLAVVKRIAESHGGCVTVKSIPGEGSTFTIKLPIERRRSIRISRLDLSDPEEEEPKQLFLD